MSPSFTRFNLQIAQAEVCLANAVDNVTLTYCPTSCVQTVEICCCSDHAKTELLMPSAFGIDDAHGSSISFVGSMMYTAN